MTEVKKKWHCTASPLQAFLTWTGSIYAVLLPLCSYYHFRILNNVHFVTEGLRSNTNMKYPPQDTNLSRFHQFILTVFSLPCISHCFWSDFLLNFSIYSLYPLKRKFKLTNKPHAHKIKTKITAAEAFISNSYRNVYLYTKLNVLPLFKFQTKYKL